MATALYDEGREAFGNGGIDWLNDAIKVVLIDTAQYTVNLTTDDFLDDIPAGARLAESAALTSKTNSAGVVDAADVVFPSLSLATPVDAFVLFVDTGVDSTSRLIAYIDNAPELPATTTGDNFTIVWDNGANKIFKL